MVSIIYDVIMQAAHYSQIILNSLFIHLHSFIPADLGFVLIAVSRCGQPHIHALALPTHHKSSGAPPT